MKTLRFLMVFCLVAISVTGSALAQNEKTSGTSVQAYVGWDFCGVERVLGTQTDDWKVWSDGRYLLKRSWSLIGQTSGAHYEASVIVQERTEDKMPGDGMNRTFVRTFHVKRDGVPYGMMHLTWHVTCTPDGELAAEVLNAFMECY